MPKPSAVVSIEPILFVGHKFNNEHNDLSIIVHFRYRSARATLEEFCALSKGRTNPAVPALPRQHQASPETLITVSRLCDISPGMLREAGTLWPQLCFTAQANSAVMKFPHRPFPIHSAPPASHTSSNELTEHTCIKPSQYISMLQEGPLPSACIKAARLVNHVMDCFDSHKTIWGLLHAKVSNRTKHRSLCQRR